MGDRGELDSGAHHARSAPTGGAALGSPSGATITIQNDDVATSLSGTKTVCASGCDYVTLTGASGLFAAVNASGLSGNLTAQITGDLGARRERPQPVDGVGRGQLHALHRARRQHDETHLGQRRGRDDSHQRRRPRHD